MAHGLTAIDWTAPWHSPWRDAGRRATDYVVAGHSVAQALNRVQADACGASVPVSVQGHARQFVAPTARAADKAYEPFIFDTGNIPTRDGLHDFFNGLVWLTFPRAKERLNALHNDHFQFLGSDPNNDPPGGRAGRGPARDGLTLLDESGALFQGPDALWDALCAKHWRLVFSDLRPLWADAQVILFGHSLPEKLVTPRKPITAHVYRVHSASFALPAVDDWLADHLCADVLSTKPFAHLPVLGIPGWWSENADPTFYADSHVFRPPRLS